MIDQYVDFQSEIEKTRRNLPHWHQEGKLQFVTFHLADSLPKDRLDDLRLQREAWIKNHPKPWSTETEREYYANFSNEIDRWLDNGFGACILRDRQLAAVVKDSMEYYDGKRYDIYAYVIMPNHVHVLLGVYEGFTLSKILHGWKGFTAFTINRMTGKSGRLWHEESFDRLIRDHGHYSNVINYIYKNIRQGGVIWRIPGSTGF